MGPGLSVSNHRHQRSWCLSANYPLHPLFHPSFHPSLSLFILLFIHPSVLLSIFPSVCLSIFLSIDTSFVRLSTYSCFHAFIHSFVYLSINPSTTCADLSVTYVVPTFARMRKTPSSVKMLVECGTTGTA